MSGSESYRRVGPGAGGHLHAAPSLPPPPQLPSFVMTRTPSPTSSHASSTTSASASPSSSSSSTTWPHSAKKRKQTTQHHNAAIVHPSRQASMDHDTPQLTGEDDMFITGAYRASRKPAQNATHELRDLRQQAVQMEQQITTLRARWKQQLPEPSVLLRACEAAKTKWVTSQAEELNRQLKEQLLQQQLYLASLQNLVLQSPFLEVSRSKEVFDALHTVTKLDGSLTEKQRRDQLLAQCDLCLRMAPSIISRFLHRHIERATVETPFSHSSIMCDGNFTYMSNLLVCRIPHPSLVAVTDAVRTYFATMHAELKHHVGVIGSFTHIEQFSASKHYAQIRYQNGPEIMSTVNTTLASQMSQDRMIFTTDFIDEDVLHPIRKTGDGSIMRDTCLALVIQPVIDEATGQRQILLQRMVVTRYNLPPNSRLVHHDIKTTLQWVNGDLLLKVICHQLEQQQQHADQHYQQLTHGHP